VSLEKSHRHIERHIPVKAEFHASNDMDVGAWVIL